MNDQTQAEQASVAATVQKLAPAARSRGWLRSWRIWFAGAVVLLAVIGSGLVWWNSSRGPDVRYVTAQVTHGPVVRTVTATGTVNPMLTVLVGTYVSGVIQELYCDYNTRVKRGQICAKIDPRPYQSIVDQQRANLGTAKAQLAKDQANLAYAKLAFERDSGLLKRGIVSQETVDADRSAYDQAQAQIDLDRATIEQRSAELRAAEVNLGYTSITSPVDGTVVSRNVTMGQTVAASFQTPTLFLIATDLTKMQVDTNVSESDIGDLKLSAKASFTVEAYPSRPFDAVVAQVRQAPQTVQNVVTYDVVLGVANKELLLKPGMTATTKIITDAREDALRVPNQALRYMPRGAAVSPARPSAAKGTPAAGAPSERVWVLRDGQPVQVDVKTGIDDESWTEIVAGNLAPGDSVIVSEQSAGARQSRAPMPRL